MLRCACQGMKRCVYERRKYLRAGVATNGAMAFGRPVGAGMRVSER